MEILREIRNQNDSFGDDMEGIKKGDQKERGESHCVEVMAS